MTSEFLPLVCRAVSRVAPATEPSPFRLADFQIGEVATDNVDKQPATGPQDGAKATRFQQNRHISPLRLSERMARPLGTGSVLRNVSFSTMSVAADVAFLISCQPIAKRQIGKCKLRA